MNKTLRNTLIAVAAIATCVFATKAEARIDCTNPTHPDAIAACQMAAETDAQMNQGPSMLEILGWANSIAPGAGNAEEMDNGFESGYGCEAMSDGSHYCGTVWIRPDGTSTILQY